MKEQQEKYNLPNGWSVATIEELIDGKNGIFKDGDWIETKDQNPDGEVRLIQLADIGDGFFRNRSDRYMTKEKALELNCTFLKKGDILVARMPDPLGRACVFPYAEEEKYVTVVDIAIIRTGQNGVDSRYLTHFINSPQIRKQIEKMQTGTTRKRISRGNLSTIKIPVPPIKEQIRIAFKIDELFSGLENGLENLKKMQNQLKVYQQALLKSAFEGNLTRKWREENKPESAEKIIAKIKAERDIQYKNDLEKWNENLKIWKEVNNQVKKPNKPQKNNYLDGFIKEELLNFSELPELWKWVKIDIITENSKNALKAGPFGSSLKKEFYVEKGYKIYGQEQVISGNAHLGNYYVNEKKFNELSSCKVKPNDILISLVGTVGKVLILPESSEEGIINPRLVKVSLNEQFFFPPLFKYYFESTFLKRLYSTQTHGATMDVLNLGIIKTLPFPLINLDEQIIISQELELQYSIIENLERIIFICLKDINSLRQSILTKAFDGNLLVQISDDEASQKLLKRIKFEKQKFLEELKKEIKSRPKKTKTMNKDLSIEDVLKTSDKPMLSKDVWQQSKHKNNIEDFYKELKKIQSNILEIKKENQSLLSLIK